MPLVLPDVTNFLKNVSLIFSGTSPEFRIAMEQTSFVEMEMETVAFSKDPSIALTMILFKQEKTSASSPNTWRVSLVFMSSLNNFFQLLHFCTLIMVRFV